MAGAQPRPTPRGVGAATLAAAMVAAGVLAPGHAAMAAAGLGLYGFLAVYGVLHAARAAAASRLRVERSIEGAGVEGEPVEVSLRLCNPSPVALELLEAIDTAPRGIVGSKPRTVLQLPPMGCGEARYRGVARLGAHRWGRVRLRVRDPLGLYADAEAVVEPLGDGSYLAAARITRAAHGLRRLLAAVSAAGSALARAMGGVTFLELREYREGDDPRLIDWKSSARRGKLLVKVLEAEALSRLLVALVVPAWAVERTGSGEAPGEAAARLAAAITAAAAEAGAETALAAAGPGAAELTPWARGRPALAAAARTAAKAVSTGSLDPAAETRRLLAAALRRRPHAAVLATPGPVPEDLVATLDRATRGRVVVATAPPETPEARRAWEERLPELAEAARGRLLVAGEGGRLSPSHVEALARMLAF